MRNILLLAAVLCLAGCTAMMVGGGNTGGYQPPKDECSDSNPGDERCKSE